MTPRIFEGGLYGENLPNGKFAVLMTGNHLITHDGIILNPPEEIAAGGLGPLYTRISDTKGFQICGQAHGITGVTWHYLNNQWVRGPASNGTSGAIFDRDGNLHTILPGPDVTSQGYRYVDSNGTLVRGDATLRDEGRAIWEYTTHGDITIGQGESGCIALCAGKRFVLAEGHCTFVRFNREGINLAVAIRQLGKMLLLWLTVDELFTLPQQLVVLPAVNRACWAGWFEFIPATLPGNCEVSVNPDMLVVDQQLRKIAHYVDAEKEGNTPEAFAHKITEGRKRFPSLPIIAYWPAGAQTGPVPPCEWPGVELYRGVNESLSAFENRGRTSLARCKKAVIIAQCYTSNSGKTTDLVSLVPIYAKLLRECPNVVGILIFSGSGRATGLQDHPEVFPLWKQLLSTIQIPKIEDVIMSVPKLTIVSYTPDRGEAPLRVKAICTLDDPEHRIQRLEWLYRVTGTQTWIIAATNYPSDPDHTYIFSNPETYEIKLRGVYDGGVAETAMLRLVRVSSVQQPVPVPDPEPQPIPQPIPQPTPTAGLKTALKTASLKYLTVAGDGALVVGNNPQEFEFVIIKAPREVAIKGPNGKYGAAEGGGNREIRFRSDAIGGWETFFIHVNPDDSITLQAHDSNLFVCAENEGNGPVVVNRLEAKGWETFVPTTPLVFKPVSTSKIEGRIRVDGRVFINDGGIFRPRFVSALTILTKNDVDMEAYLNWVVSTGFNGIRVFAGALPWAGQTPENARARLPYLLEACVDRGLYCEVAALTETRTGYNKALHVRAIGDICVGFDNPMSEIANEYWHPTQDDETHDPNYLLRLVPSLPGPVALGAGNSDEPNHEQVPQAQYITLHLDRGRDKWNQVRRVREFEAASQNYRKPVLNNEPIGADELDGSVTGKQRINDPAFFFAMGALNRLFEVGGVHHSQHGLHAVLPGPVQQACAEGYLRGFNAVKTQARLRFQNMNNTGSWPQSPVKNAVNLVRAYSGLAEDGSENVVVLVGLTGDPSMEMQNGWKLGDVVDEMPGAKVVRLIR